VRVSTWSLVLPITAVLAAVAVWREYPALVRYWRMRQM
jgi:hypothetical protein